MKSDSEFAHVTKMKLTCLLLLFLSNSLVYVYAQACGEGVFTLKIKKKPRKLHYEILSIQDKCLENVINFSETYHRGEFPIKYVSECIIPIEEKSYAPFIKEYMRKNKVRNGCLKFPTRETLRKVLVIRFYTKKQEFYLYANLFGGCDRATNIIWSENPEIIRLK